MKNELYLSYMNTPIGEMIAVSDTESILMLEFADNKNMRYKLGQIIHNAQIVEKKSEIMEVLEEELELYFNGELREFKTPIHMVGTDFQVKAWNILREIPYGQTISYKIQAKKIGDEKAYRAVANANGSNRIAILIPCHRVVGSDGSLTGYDGGVERKKFLLELEGF